MVVLGGLYKQGFLFLKVIVSDVIIVLVPMILILEIFSYIMRIISLAVRISANIIAGHTILGVVSGFVLGVIDVGFDILFLCVIVLLGVVGFEIFVCCLQAYIFLVLSCLYFNDMMGGH